MTIERMEELIAMLDKAWADVVWFKGHAHEHLYLSIYDTKVEMFKELTSPEDYARIMKYHQLNKNVR